MLLLDRNAARPVQEFAYGELRRLAPWVFEQIAAFGPEAVAAALAEEGEDFDDALPMHVWVTAIQRLRRIRLH